MKIEKELSLPVDNYSAISTTRFTGPARRHWPTNNCAPAPVQPQVGPRLAKDSPA